MLAATTAAAGAAANVVAVAESVAAELTGAAPAAGAAASPAKAHHAAPSAAAGASYTPEQLEFMRRKLNSSVRVGGGGLGLRPAWHISTWGACCSRQQRRMSSSRRMRAGILLCVGGRGVPSLLTPSSGWTAFPPLQAQPAAANGAAPAAASRAGPAPAGHEAAYSPEQLEFLRRKGVSPQVGAVRPWLLRGT